MARKVLIRAVKKKVKPTSRPVERRQRPTRIGDAIGRSAAGFATAKRLRDEQKRERENRKNQPMRYRLRDGDEGTITILDKGDPFFMYEHEWQGAKGYYDQHEVCIKDTELCPLCQKLSKEGYYVMMLTVIDHRGFTPKRGPNRGKEVKWSRKLFPVKVGMIPKYQRLYTRHGDLRGLKLKLYRDGDRAPATGSDVEFIAKVPVAKLQRIYGEQAQAFKYEELFPRLTVKEMRSKYGGVKAAGSEDVEEGMDDLDKVDFDEDEEE
jgi:hypothetical protein